MNPLLEEVLGASYSDNTREGYKGQWKLFKRWLAEQGYGEDLPIDVETVALYLCGRFEKGRSAATLRLAAAAIGFYHREEGEPNPCASPMVRKVLRGLAKKIKKAPSQAQALTQEGMNKVIETACVPRPLGLGRVESEARAKRRGLIDIALIGTMRDAQLRRSEAAALLWADIEKQQEGHGTLRIARSKTDQEGKGATLFLSKRAMQDLARIRKYRKNRPGVFGLSSPQICRRIAAACKAAGLKGRYTGHSPRVGMTIDLARKDLSLAAIQQSGRWKSPAMVGRYIRNEDAKRGAVARFYELEANAPSAP